MILEIFLFINELVLWKFEKIGSMFEIGRKNASIDRFPDVGYFIHKSCNNTVTKWIVTRNEDYSVKSEHWFCANNPQERKREKEQNLFIKIIDFKCRQ